MRKIALTLTFLAVLTSCQPVADMIYGTNREYKFYSKEEAAEHFAQKNSLEKDRIYFFESKEQKQEFYKRANLERLPYYALMLNDTTKVDDSLPEKACIGATANFINAYESFPVVQFDLNDISLKNHKEESLELNSGKPTLIYVIHSVMGRFVKKNVRYLHKNNGNNINYAYIVIDEVPHESIVSN